MTPAKHPASTSETQTRSSAGGNTASLLTVVVPVYNEEEYVALSIERALKAPIPEGLTREILAVDDGSQDGSPEVLEGLASQHPELRVLRHPVNRGKGAALRTAIDQARGEFLIIHDADLEYDPTDFLKILQPLVDGHADVVFGSRFQSAGPRRVLYFWHAFANRALTTFCNMAADLNLTDMETCYKAFRTRLIQSIPLRSERFGIEPEMTIKVAQRRARIYEVPISYHGRTYDEGKKIGLKDAIQALFLIVRHWLIRDIYRDPGARILDTLAETPRFNGWMADTIRPFLGARVLEIGAGIGNLTSKLSSRRKMYVASDIDEEHLARLRTRFHSRPNFEIVRCDVGDPNDFRTFTGCFDSVICLNVVEHVENDRMALANIASALVPGGRAIVLVPQDQKIFGDLDTVLGHYRRYAEAQLRERMEEAGLRVQQVIHFNRVTRPGWVINGRWFHRRSFGRIQLWVFDRMVPLWRVLDRWLPWGSVSIIGIGEKI